MEIAFAFFSDTLNVSRDEIDDDEVEEKFSITFNLL